MKEKILITGGAGFIGTNLALRLSKKYHVFSLDNLYKKEINNNLALLKQNKVDFINGDIRDKSFINNLISENKFNSIFHLAAQVAMSKSIEDPELDFDINVNGTLNLLNSIVNKNSNPNLKFINVSTNKVYGDLTWDKLLESNKRFQSENFIDGYDENLQLNFSSPYGCSKGSAEQYVLDYSETYGLNTMSIRLSSIFGINQYFTYEQGWIGWFINEFLKFKNDKDHEIEILGNGKQVRDILYIDDLLNLFEKIIDKDFNKLNNKVFNVGGGTTNSLSIIELLDFFHEYYDLNYEYKTINKGWRLSDQRFYISNLNSVKSTFDWEPNSDLKTKLIEYLNWIKPN